PGAELYPTLEVRGTLQLPVNVRAANYPAPIVFSQDDIERALAGTLLTKVIYLEHPDRAFATATEADQPLQIDVRSNIDPIAEARERGRPFLIVRFGGRKVADEELVGQAVPGTILLPGEKAIG